MTINELIKEINKLKLEAATTAPGAIRAGEITVALLCLYHEYMRMTGVQDLQIRKAA
jgi:hypothetical protein